MAKETLPNQVSLLPLLIGNHGGRRAGAGRKPHGPRGRVSHGTRAVVRRHEPQLITLRRGDGLPSLRLREAWEVIVGCFRQARGRHGFNVTQYSVQDSHLHLIAEVAPDVADPTEAIRKGLQGLMVRLARQLNKLWGRKGTFWGDRYHAVALTSPRQVRNALRYVLLNAVKHRSWNVAHGLDPLSTSKAFDGWRALAPAYAPEDYGCAQACSWLLQVGWRRYYPPLDPRDPPRAP